LYYSSPYLFVIGDDRVICYTRANDVVGSVGEAKRQSRATWGFDFIVILLLRNSIFIYQF